MKLNWINSIVISKIPSRCITTYYCITLARLPTYFSSLWLESSAQRSFHIPNTLEAIKEHRAIQYSRKEEKLQVRAAAAMQQALRFRQQFYRVPAFLLHSFCPFFISFVRTLSIMLYFPGLSLNGFWFDLNWMRNARWTLIQAHNTTQAWIRMSSVENESLQKVRISMCGMG